MAPNHLRARARALRRTASHCAQLELALAKLRDTKATLTEDEYYRRLELLLLDLARLYEQPGS